MKRILFLLLFIPFIGLSQSFVKKSDQLIIGTTPILSGINNSIFFQHNNIVKQHSLFAFDSTNNFLFIGVNTGDVRLDVKGIIDADSGLRILNNMFLSAKDTFGTYRGIIKLDNTNTFVLGSSQSYPIAFTSAGTERMRMLTDGKFGIGTNNPSNLLHLFSNTATTNSLVDVAVIDAHSTGTAANGLGGALLFHSEDAAGNEEQQIRLGALWTTATNGSEASAFVIQTRTVGAALSEAVRIVDNKMGIGVDPLALRLHLKNGSTGAAMTAAQADSIGLLVESLDNGIKTSLAIAHNTSIGGTTSVPNALQFWSNSFGGGMGFTASIGWENTQGTATSKTNGNLIFSTANDDVTPAERVRLTNTGTFAIGTASPNAKALLDISSTTKGLMLPRMTSAQRIAMALVAGDAGIVVFQTDGTIGFYGWDGTNWVQF